MSQVGQLNAVIFPPGSVVEFLTGNSGGPVPPDGANNINIIGAGVVDVAGNPATNTLTITVDGTVATTYTTDAGNAVPAAGVLNILGNHGINTAGAGNTVTIEINNAITLGDLVPLLAVDAITLTTGDISIDAGSINLPFSNALGTEGFINVAGTPFLSTLGTGNAFLGNNIANLTLNTGVALFNTGVGAGIFQSLTTGANNSVLGASAFDAATSATNSVALGTSSLTNVTSGSSNIALGSGSGTAITTEDNNILIASSGVGGDTGRIRIGINGTHTTAFITGIEGVNVGSTAQVVTMGTAGTADQLGTAVITAGAGITVTPGANTITIAATGSDLLTYTPVNTSPYVVLAADEFLGVDCSGGAIIIQLPNAPSTGRVINIKDTTGSANTNNITVTTVGGVVNIDGATSYTMNTQYAAINVLFDGATYQIW